MANIDDIDYMRPTPLTFLRDGACSYGLTDFVPSSPVPPPPHYRASLWCLLLWN